MKNNKILAIENKPILNSHAGHLELRHLYEGIHVFGATGSGKSSTMKFTAIKLLNLGLGGIVLCDKPDEAENWQEWGEKAGRTKDILYLSEERFNFLDYEAKRKKGGGDTESIVAIIMEILSADKLHEDIWLKSATQLLRNCIDLLLQAEEKISLKNILKIVSNAPKNDDEIIQIKGTWFGELIIKAELRDHYDFEIMSNYWLADYPALSDKTRSSITQTLTAIADKLARGKIGQIFNTESTFNFDDLRNGKILICDISNKEYGETGKFSNILIKYMFQKMCERRHHEITPAFIWVDEAQSFLSKNDTNFLQTARSSKVVNIYLTQNVHNYYAVLGGSGHAKSLVQSLLGNFQTKVFFQNTDIETNEYASNLIGKILQRRNSSSKSISNIVSTSTSISQARDYQIQPHKFGGLKKGGLDFNFIVGYIIFNPAIPNRYIYTRINQKTGKQTKPTDIMEETEANPFNVGCFMQIIGAAVILGFIIIYYYGKF